MGLAAAALLSSPDAARACAVCYGDPNSAQTKAMAAGILVLLAVIGSVLAAFAGVFVYWIHRSHKLTLENEGATY